MPTRSALLFALIVAAISSTACAPKVAPAATTPVRTCTNPSLSGATETRQKPLFVTAELGYEAPDTARGYAVNLLSEFEKVFRLPSPIGFVVWDADGRDSTAVPTIASEASLTVGQDGQLIGIALTQSSLVARVDSALLSALRTAVESGGVLPPSVHRIVKPLTIFVALSVGPSTERELGPEAAPQERPVMPRRRTVELPLRLLDLPVKRFSAMVKSDLERSTRVAYPADLGRAQWEGDVDLEYVVGKNGTVVPGTIRVIGGTERRFVATAIEALKGTRFVPAEIDGCPVSVLVLQRLSFRAGRREVRFQRERP